MPPDAALEDQVPSASGAKPAASAQSHSAALQGPAVEPERDKHGTSPPAADPAQALMWQPSPAARRKAGLSKHPSAAQHVSVSKERPAPPPRRRRQDQRPARGRAQQPPGYRLPGSPTTRLEPAAAAQPSHQSSARSCSPFPCRWGGGAQTLPCRPAASGQPSAPVAVPPDLRRSRPRKQTASSPLRHPEGNSYAESSQAAAGSSADTTTSELSRASSSSPFPELLGSSPASHGPGRQEQPQDSAQQPPTVHRAPIRLPRPAPQGTPAAFAFPTLAQELLASIFSGPAPNTRRG